MSEPTYQTVAAPLSLTASAAAKVASLIAEEANPELKLRVYISGGGCSGVAVTTTGGGTGHSRRTSTVRTLETSGSGRQEAKTLTRW